MHAQQLPGAPSRPAAPGIGPSCGSNAHAVPGAPLHRGRPRKFDHDLAIAISREERIRPAEIAKRIPGASEDAVRIVLSRARQRGVAVGPRFRAGAPKLGPIPPMHRRVLEILKAAHPEPVSPTDLTERMYAGCCKPADPIAAVRAHISQMRRRMRDARSPILIAMVKQGGLRGYKIRKAA